MPLDEYGNWFPILPDNPSPTNRYGELINGVGVPSNSLGNNGDVYINISNGDVYSKAGDVWIVTGTVGGGGATQVYTGSFADPNGNVTPSDTAGAAWYYQNSATNNVWRWIVASQTWEQSLG